MGLTSCGGPKEVEIDNPTDKEITVKIGDKEAVKIPAESTKTMKLAEGEYKISLDDKVVGTIKRTKEDVNAVINPTLSTYVNDYVSYEEKTGITPESDFPQWKVEYIGYEFEGPFTVSNELYVNFGSDYNLTQTLPEELKTFSEKKYDIKTKVFRIKDYFSEYASTYDVTAEDFKAAGISVDETKIKTEAKKKNMQEAKAEESTEKTEQEKKETENTETKIDEK